MGECGMDAGTADVDDVDASDDSAELVHVPQHIFDFRHQEGECEERRSELGQEDPERNMDFEDDGGFRLWLVVGTDVNGPEPSHQALSIVPERTTV